MRCRLKAHQGKAVVLAGSRHSEELQRIVIAINNEIGSYGGPMVVYETGRAEYGTIEDFEADVDQETSVVLLGPANPLFDRPGERFARVLKKAKVSIHLGVRTDATALGCDWQLESRSDTGLWCYRRPGAGICGFSDRRTLWSRP